MELDNQGQPTNGQPDAALLEEPQGQVQPEPADLSTLTPFQAEPVQPATPAQPAQGQVPVQPVVQEQSAAYFQSEYNKALAKSYALEAELARYQQQPPQMQQQSQPQANPYDMATQYEPWLNWRDEQNRQRIVREVEERNQQWLGNLLQQTQEAQWGQQHPGIDINMVKGWMRANGVSNINHAFTLMTLPQTLQATAQAAITQQSPIRQQTAQPLRNTQSAASAQQSYRFDTTLKAYTDNPNIADSWPKDFKDGFFRELHLRNEMAQGR